MEREIYSDDVSETHRKYIFKTKLSNGNCYYSLWGTDLSNEDNDYLLVNSANKILAFSKIVDLLSYINESSGLFDEENTKKWARLYRNNRAYSTYDLTSLLPFFDEVTSIAQYEADNAMELIDFFNLFSDFANQIKSHYLIELYQKASINVFIDYLYMLFFWDAPDASCELEMKNKITTINLPEIREIIEEMINVFESNILIIQPSKGL